MTDENLPDIVRQDAPASADDRGGMSLGEMWSSMLELAKDPSVDAAKIEHLVGLQEKMVDRTAGDRFRRAFAQACRDMPVITKDDKIEHKGRFIGWFKKYEDLRGIVDQIINPLGLTITHDSSEIDGGKGGVTVWTVITFMDDEYTWVEERGKMPVPPDGGGAKSAAQALGSSVTYGQRYSLAAAFGIVQKGLDRDGSTPARQISNSAASGLVDEAKKAASKGMSAYEEWFKARDRADRVTLTTKTEPHPAIDGAEITVHDLCKQMAKAAD